MSLHNKRLGQVTKLLPLSSRVLGRHFSDAFRGYAKTTPPGGTKKHLGDALAFAEHLEKTLRREGQQPRWVLDLLRYERSRVKAADPRRHVVVSFFRHDISRLVRSLARKEDAMIFGRVCVAVWARRKRGGIIRYALYMLPTLPRRK